jgi:hypothetical protein
MQYSVIQSHGDAQGLRSSNHAATDNTTHADINQIVEKRVCHNHGSCLARHCT